MSPQGPFIFGPHLLSEGTSGERLVALARNAAPQRLGRCLAGYAAAPICLLLPGVAVTEGRFALRPPYLAKVPRHNHLGVAQSPKQLRGASEIIAPAQIESNPFIAWCDGLREVRLQSGLLLCAVGQTRAESEREVHHHGRAPRDRGRGEVGDDGGPTPRRSR
jgi:hypothetical protein